MTRSRRWWWAATPGLLALVALAAWRLNRQSLWVDEVFSLAATHDLGLSLRSTKGTMAGYYIVLWIWAQVGTATWWLRAFSTLGAGVAVVLVAAIARRSQPGRAAWVAPLVLVGLPIFAWTATEARSYAWETALVAGCWWLILRGVEAYQHREPGEARWWIGLATCCAVGPLLHGLFILQVPGFLVIALLKPSVRRPMLRRILPAVFAALVPTYAIYMAGGSSMGASWAYDSVDRVRVLQKWFLGPEPWIAALVGLAALIGAVSAVAQARRSRSLLGRTQALLPVLWGPLALFAALAIAEVSGPFAPYYMASSAAGIALLAARPLTSPGSWKSSVGPRAAQITVVGATVVLLASVGVGAVRHPITYHENWRGAARMVAGDVHTGDAIVFTGSPGSSFGTSSGVLGFTAAWREDPHATNPMVLSHDRQLDQPVIREVSYEGVERIQRAWFGHDRVWLIDYQNLLEPSGILDDPRIQDAYCLRETARFAPNIEVRRYDRRPADSRCPSG